MNRRPEPVGQRAVGGQRHAPDQLGRHRAQRRGPQVVEAGEVAVEQRPGDVRGARHVLDAHLLGGALAVQPHRDGDQVLAASRGRHPPRRTGADAVHPCARTNARTWRAISSGWCRTTQWPPSISRTVEVVDERRRAALEGHRDVPVADRREHLHGHVGPAVLRRGHPRGDVLPVEREPVHRVPDAGRRHLLGPREHPAEQPGAPAELGQQRQPEHRRVPGPRHLPEDLARAPRVRRNQAAMWSRLGPEIDVNDANRCGEPRVGDGVPGLDRPPVVPEQVHGPSGLDPASITAARSVGQPVEAVARAAWAARRTRPRRARRR